MSLLFGSAVVFGMAGLALAGDHRSLKEIFENCPNDPECLPAMRRAWEDREYQRKVTRDGKFDFSNSRWNCTHPEMLQALIADIDDKIIAQTHNPLVPLVYGIFQAKEVDRNSDRLTCHGIWHFEDQLHNQRDAGTMWYWVNGTDGHAQFFWNAD
jgi:hypothetical protein